LPGVRLLAAAVGAVLIVLMPLAHGSPIDPSTPGFWDNGDFDDVIIFLTSHLHFLDIDPLPVIAVSRALDSYVIEHLVRAGSTGAYDLGSPRAPPAV
jgi:hypothetical protein